MTQVFDSALDRETKEKINRNFISAVNTVLRKNKALNLKPKNESALSELLGQSRQLINNIKNGNRSPTNSQISIFSQRFLLPIQWIFENIDPAEEIEYDIEKYAESINEGRSHNETNFNWSGDNANTKMGDVFSGEFKGDFHHTTVTQDDKIDELQAQLRDSQDQIRTLNQTIDSERRMNESLRYKVKTLNDLNESLSKEIEFLRGRS